MTMNLRLDDPDLDEIARAAEVDPDELYRSLSDLEAFRMNDLKIKAEVLIMALRAIGNKEASWL
jgi:hypothetical protein